MAKRAITLLGTSGVGKTTLSECLVAGGWYHYSGDYRIATHYLHEPLSAWLAQLAGQVPQLAALLSAEALSIRPQVQIDNLRVVSAFIGKVGQGGYDYATFCARQRQFEAAEKAAMYDFAHFCEQAAQRHVYTRFINDAGGSLCEYIDDQALMDYLFAHTLPVYIRADQALAAELLERALRYPKPICYDQQFLDRMIAAFAEVSGIANIDDAPADEFIRFVLPKLMAHRDARAMALVARGGVVLEARDVWQVRDSRDFEALLDAAQRQQHAASEV